MNEYDKEYLSLVFPNWSADQPAPTWPNFDQFCMWIGANNDQIRLPIDWMSDSEPDMTF